MATQPYNKQHLAGMLVRCNCWQDASLQNLLQVMTYEALHALGTAINRWPIEFVMHSTTDDAKWHLVCSCISRNQLRGSRRHWLCTEHDVPAPATSGLHYNVSSRHVEEEVWSIDRPGTLAFHKSIKRSLRAAVVRACRGLVRRFIRSSAPACQHQRHQEHAKQ